jgi:hypothetical protein
VRAFVRHAINFQTWRSLVREQKLKDAEAVELVVKVVLCLASKGSRRRLTAKRLRQARLNRFVSLGKKTKDPDVEPQTPMSRYGR